MVSIERNYWIKMQHFFHPNQVVLHTVCRGWGCLSPFSCVLVLLHYANGLSTSLGTGTNLSENTCSASFNLYFPYFSNYLWLLWLSWPQGSLCANHPAGDSCCKCLTLLSNWRGSGRGCAQQQSRLPAHVGLAINERILYFFSAENKCVLMGKSVFVCQQSWSEL